MSTEFSGDAVRFGSTRPPRLTKPPIELTVCQIRYPVVPKLLNPEAIEPFREKLASEYPRLSFEQHDSVAMGGVDGPSVDRRTLYKFEDPNQFWTVAVSPDFVAVEVPEYTKFDDFKGRLKTALRYVNEVYDVGLRTRIGLRYVDVVSSEKYPDLDKKKLADIACKIVPSRRFFADVAHQSKVEHRIVLDDASRRAGIVRFVASPSVTDSLVPDLRLDIDVFSEMDVALFEELDAFLDSAKDFAYAGFSWAFETLFSEMHQ